MCKGLVQFWAHKNCSILLLSAIIVAIISKGTQGTRGSFQKEKVNQRGHACIRNSGKKKQNKAKQSKALFWVYRKAAQAALLLPCPVFTNVFDVPVQDLETL